MKAVGSADGMDSPVKRGMTKEGTPGEAIYAIGSPSSMSRRTPSRTPWGMRATSM